VPPPFTPSPVQPPHPAAVGPSTVYAPAPGSHSRLFFHSTEGWNMELADGDILGRLSGNHVDRLGGNSFISGSHAQVSHKQDGWYIIDQKSTNKTFVDGVEAAPFTPVRLKPNAVVQLANIKFVVREL
jgi:hypothetical protein